MRNATICFIIDRENKKLLLAMKKRGFGVGKWNGYGGKQKDGESVEESAVRELLEESGIEVKPKELEKFAEINFTFKTKKDWDQCVHVFVAKSWKGEPIETEEMKPEWFHFEKIPYASMWADDIHWLPVVLQSKKLFGNCFFADDNSSVEKFEIKEVKGFE